MINKEQVNIHKYPNNNDSSFLVTLDDLHPQGTKDGGNDFGFDNFNKNNFFWNQLYLAKEKIPEIKFTLFTVANWIDKPDFPSGIFSPLRRIFRIRRSYPLETFNLSKKDFNSWINFINKKTEEGLIEIGLHGYTHHNPIKKFAPSQEFKGISEKRAEEKINQTLETFDKSGLKYAKIFRIPGWGFENYLSKLLKRYGINYLANSSDFYSNILEKSQISGILNQNITELNHIENGIYNLTANCYPDQTSRAVSIAKTKGVIVIHGHISQTTLGLKYVDKNFANNLITIKNEIENQTLNKIWFTSVYEFCNYQDALRKVTFDINEDSIVFKNNSEVDLNGFTFSIANQSFILNLKSNSNHKFNLKNLSNFDEGIKVSCILTVYNGEITILESLNSITTQTYKNLEIIIINDGSNDNTKNLIEDYIKKTGDLRIVLLNQENQGRSKSRNNGANVSNGEIITFMEDDAIYHKDYILNASKHFAEMLHGKCGGIIGPHYVWNKTNSVTTRVKDIERRRNFLNYKPFSTWFYSKEMFTKIGGFNENLEFGEDVEPAKKIKKLGYHFTFEPNCRWLHKEPENFFNYLKRKFKGGIGIASLEKLDTRKNIVPLKWFLILITTLFLGITSIYLLNLAELFFAFIFIALFLILIRVRDIKKGLKVSDEKLLFISFGIYIEYIWWFSTFCGYIYGKIIDNNRILKELRGR